MAGWLFISETDATVEDLHSCQIALIRPRPLRVKRGSRWSGPDPFDFSLGVTSPSRCRRIPESKPCAYGKSCDDSQNRIDGKAMEFLSQSEVIHERKDGRHRREQPEVLTPLSSNGNQPPKHHHE